MQQPSKKSPYEERERRFLVRGEPPESTDVSRIVDRYVVGTRIRLRCVDDVVWKLTRIEDVGHGCKFIATMGISADEFRLLSQLPARVLVKERRRIWHAGFVWAVDIHADGLVIAEVEHAEGENPPVPDWCGEEVTGDSTYAGYAMAT